MKKPSKTKINVHSSKTPIVCKVDDRKSSSRPFDNIFEKTNSNILHSSQKIKRKNERGSDQENEVILERQNGKHCRVASDDHKILQLPLFGKLSGQIRNIFF